MPDNSLSQDATAVQEPIGSAEPTAIRLPQTPVILFLLGLLIFAFPTMKAVAQESWNTEQGAHGPIILSTGLWLLWRLWPDALAVARAPDWRRVALIFLGLLPLYLLARITQVIEIEGYLMYACLLTALYSVIGGQAMKRLWFPLLYIAFIFPPPDTIVVAATGPMKIWISKIAVWTLGFVGLPIAGQGVSIYIGQYELLVAAACSGLNSIISLSAIALFYVYLRHQAQPAYAIILVLMILPVALLANLIRVLILILLTFYAGDAAAQGFLHNFAGIAMFAIALLTIFALDAVLKPWFDRLLHRESSQDPWLKRKFD